MVKKYRWADSQPIGGERSEEGKHTPGPWKAESNGMIIALETPPILVAEVQRIDKVAYADAALIAAAPELLEALKGVLTVADRKTIEFDAARAAIAKAEGRS